MAMPEMDQVKDAALKYDKPTLARMAQMGQMSPTIAVMAGMMRDRIVQSEMKPPAPPTVAQEVMQSMGARMGLGAIAPQGQPQQPQAQGIDQIPVPEQMFEPQGMAGGGIVAFSNGGIPIERLLRMMNLQERAEYQRTGKLPQRLQNMMEPEAQDSETARFARQGTGVPMSSAGLAAQGFTPPAAPPAPPRGASNLPSTAQTAAQQAAVQQATTPLGLEQEFAQDYATIQRVLGEDTTRAKLKELYEKQEKAAESDAKRDEAMRLIEAGLLVAGGTSPYAGANFALAAPVVRGAGEDVRTRRKEATERAKSLAELEGMTRKEKADILTQTMARRREEKKTKEDREFRKELVRLEASLKPEDFNRYAARILEKGTPAQKAAVEKLLERGRGSSGSMPKLSFEDAMKAAESQYGFQWQKMSAEDKARAADIIYRKYNQGVGTTGWGEMSVSGGR